jgi:hypothetical protein
MSSWRRKSPQPVVFKALDRMDSSRVHLHLQHPFVQRILSRFLAQGGSSAGPEPGHHLPENALVRVVAFGRLSLFGPGAVCFTTGSCPLPHVTEGLETMEKGHLEPFADQDDRKALEMLTGQFKGKNAGFKGLPWKLEVEFASQPSFRYSYKSWDFGEKNLPNSNWHMPSPSTRLKVLSSERHS